MIFPTSFFPLAWNSSMGKVLECGNMEIYIPGFGKMNTSTAHSFMAAAISRILIIRQEGRSIGKILMLTVQNPTWIPFIIHSPEMISRLYPTTNTQRGIALLCACRKGKCGKQLVSSTYLSLRQSVVPRSMWFTSSPVSQTAVTQLGAKAHVRGETMSRHGEGFFSSGFNFPFPFSCVWNLTHLPGLYLAHGISFKSSTNHGLCLD